MQLLGPWLQLFEVDGAVGKFAGSAVVRSAMSAVECGRGSRRGTSRVAVPSSVSERRTARRRVAVQRCGVQACCGGRSV